MPTPDANASTFESLYYDRWSKMVRLAALTTGSEAIAEEIVQEAFVQLLRNWATVHNPTLWLRIAVVNGCRGWVRHRVVERRHNTEATGTTEADHSVVIRDALGRLSWRQRAAVVLRFYEDLPEREIAEILGCRPGTVKSLLDRAKTTLRKELES